MKKSVIIYLLSGHRLEAIQVKFYFSGQSAQFWQFLRPDRQSELILTFLVYACCNLNIFGEIFEILPVNKTEIFRNFHLASSPIFRGPGPLNTH